LDRAFENIPYHKNVRYSKQEYPTLPEGFRPHIGDYKEGCVGQYRRRLLHAYDMKDHWLIHKDKYDPDTNPIEHLIHDTDMSLLSIFERLHLSFNGWFIR